MKLKFLFLSSLFSIWSFNAQALDAGLRHINTAGVVKCGTDLNSKTYAYQDKDGFWRGIDVDLCKAFATAIFGDSKYFKMVHVDPQNMSSALASNKIDIMFGSNPASASQEMSQKANPVEILYYDRLMFLGKKLENATSMEDYKNATVCAVSNSEDLNNLEEYSAKYQLDLKPILFANATRAKEAFLLKRCTLMVGGEVLLKSIYNSMNNENMNLVLLPEVITIKPAYAQTHKDNITLRIISKWIINSLALAEEYEINSQNVNVFIGLRNNSMRNLLGVEPKLWKKFGLKPDWVKIYIAENGNYGEVYERNLGKNSALEIERKENLLISKGGFIKPQPLL